MPIDAVDVGGYGDGHGGGAAWPAHTKPTVAGGMPNVRLLGVEPLAPAPRGTEPVVGPVRRRVVNTCSHPP